MECTLVLIKPDGVKRGLVGEIISFYERKNMRIREIRMLQATKKEAEEHYVEHKGREYFDKLISYITADNICAIIVEGEGAIQNVRVIHGDKNPLKADTGSIRGMYSSNTTENLVHASDTPENAKREIKIWFPDFEL